MTGPIKETQRQLLKLATRLIKEEDDADRAERAKARGPIDEFHQQKLANQIEIGRPCGKPSEVRDLFGGLGVRSVAFFRHRITKTVHARYVTKGGTHLTIFTTSDGELYVTEYRDKESAIEAWTASYWASSCTEHTSCPCAWCVFKRSNSG